MTARISILLVFVYSKVRRVHVFNFAHVRVSLKLVLSHENKIKRVFVFVGSCNFIYAFSFTLFSLKQLFTSIVMKIISYLWSLVNYSSMLIPTLEL